MSAKPGVDALSTTSRKMKFYTVASTSSSDHLLYHRDLVLLLNLSMEMGEHDLALDLGKFSLFKASE